MKLIMIAVTLARFSGAKKLKLTIHTRRINYLSHEFEVPKYHSSKYDDIRYEYIATNKDGTVFIYTDKPGKALDGFYTERGEMMFIAELQGDFPFDWKDSLKKIKKLQTKANHSDNIKQGRGMNERKYIHERGSDEAPQVVCPHCGAIRHLYYYAVDFKEGVEEGVEVECNRCLNEFLADIEAKFIVSFYTKTYKMEDEE